MTFQENVKQKFEKIVEELKDAELEEWEIKNNRKIALRSFKDTLSRVKNRIKNLYINRFEKDLKTFRMSDLQILNTCIQFKEYFTEFTVNIKDKDSLVRTTDSKEIVTNKYNLHSHDNGLDLIIYNPEWPPFRDEILDATYFFNKGSIKKIQKSFETLLDSIDHVTSSKEDGIDKYYFETLDNILNRL